MTGRAIVIRADARRLPLPDASVDLIVTSPPYWGLRDYGYPGQIGGEADWQNWLDTLLDCTREWVRVLKPEGSLWVNLGDKYNSAASGQNLDGFQERIRERLPHVNVPGPKRYAGQRGTTVDGIGPKSLLGLPWRYALGCIDHLGLILRAEVVWNKPNGLPESVTDRVRRSHEQWFWLTRWAPDTPPPPELIRAVLREVAAGTLTVEEGERILSADMQSHDACFMFTRQPRYYSAVDEIREPQRMTGGGDMPNRRAVSSNGGMNHRDFKSAKADYNPLGKLPGSVWSIPSEPLNVPPELGVDHFAAMPTAWPRRIIQGWSPPGICTECGEGRRPVVDKMHERPAGDWNPSRKIENRPVGIARPSFAGTITGYVCACTPYTDHEGTGQDSGPHGGRGNHVAGRYPNVGVSSTAGGTGHLGNRPRVGARREYHLNDWTPPPMRPTVVLDPMGGTGTTALVAKALGRVGITVDLSGDYARLAKWRVNDRGELAKVLGVPKPPKPVTGQLELGEVS